MAAQKPLRCLITGANTGRGTWTPGVDGGWGGWGGGDVAEPLSAGVICTRHQVHVMSP
jgi:hypothetical protein